jgi:putative ABC transport system permease protein
MKRDWWLAMSERWLRLLVRLYPADFRDELGNALVETYRDRCRAALQRGGATALMRVWWTALMDSVRNGPGERVQPAVRWRRSGNWGRDMELAFRRLTRAPLFVLTMVGTLAVGLGAFAVVASVVYKVVIAPLPYDNPDDLYFVWRDYRAFFDLDRGWVAGTDVAELQKAGGVIESAAAIRRDQATLNAGSDVEPMEIAVMGTSPNLFDILGVQPLFGRTFRPEETGPDGPAVIVLTYGLWQKLGGQQSILESDVRLNDMPFRVIGVLPKTFAFVRNASLGEPQSGDAYIPLQVVLAETNPNGGAYGGLIRARHGATPQQVREAVTSVARVVDTRDFASRGLKLYAVGLHDDLIADVRPVLLVLGLAGVFLVLVLMVNLATLLLARATQREKEFAVSRALGANPFAVVRATLLEGGILGVLGGATGAVAAIWGTKLLVSLAPADLPRREFIAMDWTVGAVVVGVGAVVGVLAAALPAAWAARTNLAVLLGNTAVRGGGGQGQMRRGMVVVQVALSLVLLATGGLVVRSFGRLLRADPGFDATNVLTVRVPISDQRFPKPEDVVALQDLMNDRLSALPGVIGVSATDALPLGADANQTSIVIANAPGNTGEREHDNPLIDYIGVREGYFDVMGMHMLEGRDFQVRRTKNIGEAVIDSELAEYFFPTGSALGARIPFGDPDTLVIVGVVQQARLYDVHEDGRGQVYIRADDWGYSSLSWAIRTERDPEQLIDEVRTAIHQIDPQLALANVQSMSDVVKHSLSQQRVSAVLIGGFAAGGLLLAAMGLFGVVSAAVTRRRHELAVRLALGAEHGRVLRLVLSEGAQLVLLGVAIGVPGTYFSGRAISATLVGVSPSDPLTLSSVGVGLGLVALAACYVPARRVLGIEPAASLRNDSA